MYRVINSVFVSILFICSLQTVNAGNLPENDKIPQTTKAIKRLFFNVPSPLEVSGILKRINLPYNTDLMNPYKNVENYLSQSDVALNIGVYGADLSYIRIYEQYQDAARYLAVIKKMTATLGVPESQEHKTLERVETNIENQDSLLNIISNTFTKSDMYLKENRRSETAALIVLGGWVETLYLSVNSLDLKHPNKELEQLIAEQKYSLKNLMGLLSQYKNDATIKLFLPDFIKLNAVFEEIKQVKISPARIKLKNGRTIIQNRVKLSVPKGIMAKIKQINNRIRNRICGL